MKKYKLIDEPNTNLKRIVALRDFLYVKVGDKGGLIESEDNLSHDGNCWIYDNAHVSEKSVVSGNAQVFGNARVSENAHVYGDACVYGNARISENARVSEKAHVYGDACVCDNARVSGDVKIEHSHQILNIWCGVKYNLTITPDYVQGGCRTFTHEEFENLTLNECQDKTWTQNELDGYKLLLTVWKLNNDYR